MLGVLVEPLSKHSQYVGFYLPKLIEAIFNILVKKQLIKDFKMLRAIIVFLMCGAIGLAHSRGHYDKT